MGLTQLDQCSYKKGKSEHTHTHTHTHTETIPFEDEDRDQGDGSSQEMPRMPTNLQKLGDRDGTDLAS